MKFGAPVDPSGEAAMLGAAARQAPASAVAAPKPTPLQIAGQAIAELPQNAGLAARGFVKGAMSLPTMIADPVTALWNKIAPPGMEQLPPSEGITTMFAKLGVKDPQTKAQGVLEALTMGLGSSAAGLGTGAALAAPVGTAEYGIPALLGAGTKLQGIGRALATQPIADLAGSGATKGQFGFSEFTKMYQGLRANPGVYKQIVKNLGPESDSVLRDLYEVSKRVTDSRANVLTTGKANQALVNGLTAQSLVEKALGSVVGKGIVAAGGATAGVGLGGGVFGASVGAGMSNAIVDSLSRGEKSKLEAVGKLFRSKEFQDLITDAGIKDAIDPTKAKALARSGAFQSFAKAVKLPIATNQLDSWILSAATAKNADMASSEAEKQRNLADER
jgi:hypothetical protein